MDDLGRVALRRHAAATTATLSTVGDLSSHLRCIILTGGRGCSTFLILTVAHTPSLDMPISPQSLQHVYHLLTKRESARASHTDPFHQLTHRLHRHPAPEEVFYSVHNSVKYRTSNRYSNILAYDRTAVQVDGDGYLNANVVCDGKGSWWVASQVSGGGAGMGEAKEEKEGAEEGSKRE
jgi:hypothetical protein